LASLLPACGGGPSGTETGSAGGCIPNATVLPAAASGNIEHRAYVASRDTGNITAIDLDSMSIIASINTCSPGYHMMELNADFTKGYASSNTTGTVDVIDIQKMTVTGSLTIGTEPTHMSLSRDGALLAVVAEKSNTVSFIDPVKDKVVKQLPGFYEPHFVRFAPDGKYAYVANLGAYHITRIDLSTLTIDGHIPLSGYQGPPNAMPTEMYEGGFADAQIDANGILWAAHRESGQTLVYDTNTLQALPQQFAGHEPWIVYAQHPFTAVKARAVPVWGDLSVAVFEPPVAAANLVDTEENESYGVNYTSLAAEKAFVMNRKREEIAVVNTSTFVKEATIPVGGTTETASTTADGKYIVAAVSSANRVVVIDAMTNTIVKAFDNVGKYPWTVTIPQGQNYCH
jgi:DNA-binding beta-propeller fold protein YncE